MQESIEKRLANKNRLNIPWHALIPEFFINPAGDVVRLQNLLKFCKEHNLNQGAMQMVASGKRRQHKGWTKPI